MTQMLEGVSRVEVVDISSTDHTMSASKATRGLYVGGAGDIVVDFDELGTAITISGVSSGTLLPIRITKVVKVGTTATNMIACF